LNVVKREIWMERAGERPAVGETGPSRDGELVRAGLSGDQAALEQLFRPHERALVSLCCGILGSAEDAEDAAQETFLRALRSLSRFRGDAAFRSWLFRIAINLCLEWKRTRHPTERWERQDEGAAPVGPSPEAVVLTHLRLMDALSCLPAHRRAVLLLKEWEGCNLTEIAQVMGWTETRVKNELYKARRGLIEWRRQEAAEGETER
jgi:RNA polymerase sigma-70 factor (ECF subfamily)